MRLQLSFHENLKVFWLGRRYCTHTSLLLGEARQQWMNLSWSQMCKALGRRPYALANPARANLVGDVIVKTCRVVCTDRYVPAAQLLLSCPPRLATLDNTDITQNTWRSYRHQYVEPGGHLPVEISWQPMKKELNNLVTVGDVLDQLSSEDRLMFGPELLRVHLMTQHNGSYSNIFYFSIEEFFERIAETKQWLASIRSIADFICTQRQSMAADNSERDGRLLSVLAYSKKLLLQNMDYMWYLGAASHRHRQLTDKVKKLVLGGGCSVQMSMRVLKEMCIILNIISPTTAQHVWNRLPSDLQLTGGGGVERLKDQKWPETNMSTNTSWPIFMSVRDPNNKCIATYRSPISRTRPQELTDADLRDWFMNKTRRVPGCSDISIEYLWWRLDRKERVVKATITVQATDDITEQLSLIG